MSELPEKLELKKEGWLSDSFDSLRIAVFLLNVPDSEKVLLEIANRYNHYPSLLASHKELVKVVDITIRQLGLMAKQLDIWAEESKSGGWSIHQVKPMKELSEKIYIKIGELMTRPVTEALAAEKVEEEK